jgi:hypothetical protein
MLLMMTGSSDRIASFGVGRVQRQGLNDGFFTSPKRERGFLQVPKDPSLALRAGKCQHDGLSEDFALTLHLLDFTIQPAQVAPLPSMQVMRHRFASCARAFPPQQGDP